MGSWSAYNVIPSASAYAQPVELRTQLDRRKTLEVRYNKLKLPNA